LTARSTQMGCREIQERACRSLHTHTHHTPVHTHTGTPLGINPGAHLEIRPQRDGARTRAGSAATAAASQRTFGPLAPMSFSLPCLALASISFLFIVLLSLLSFCWLPVFFLISFSIPLIRHYRPNNGGASITRLYFGTQKSSGFRSCTSITKVPKSISVALQMPVVLHLYVLPDFSGTHPKKISSNFEARLQLKSFSQSHSKFAPFNHLS